METTESTTLWPLALYLGLALTVALGMLGISSILGGRRDGRSTGKPYESGIAAADQIPLRMSVKYFKVALFFVVFDLEVVFLVAWALVARRLGWTGYLGMLVFVGVLGLSLVYLWRIGALDWGTTAETKRRAALGKRG